MERAYAEGTGGMLANQRCDGKRNKEQGRRLRVGWAGSSSEKRVFEKKLRAVKYREGDG